MTDNPMSFERQLESAPPPFRRVPLFPDEPKTLGELFSQSLAKFDRPDCMNYKSGGRWTPISSKRMSERIANIAAGLHSLGLRNGDRVAILAANSPEWTITDAACQTAGFVDVPIYTTLAPHSVAYVINDSGTRVFFLEDLATYERLKQSLTDCSSIEKLVFFDSAGVTNEIGISLAELEDLGAETLVGEPSLISKLSSVIGPHDIATLIYTSGTTGEPKGVMLSHQNLVSNVIDAGEKYRFTRDDVPLSVLPLSHVFERTGMYLYFFNGMGIYFAESIDKVADNLREVRPTIFVGVPRIFEKVYAKAKQKAGEDSPIKEKLFDWAIDVGKKFALINENREKVPFMLAVKHSLADKLVFSKFRDFFGGRLRFCVTGGAALSNDIWLIFTGAGIAIMQGYGLTETSPVISSNNPIDARLGSVGKPIRNTEVRVASDGEIEVKGAGVMRGYYNKPDASRDAFTDDGFFKTGDIGEIDADGFLKITDRKKELFKTSGGKYIAPSPIEQKIKASRFVSQVVLVGNDRKFPAALIVPNFEQLANFARNEGLNLNSPEEYCAHERIVRMIETEIETLTDDLAKYERVKKIALLTEELTIEGGELTPTLKVKRRVVDEKYIEIIERIYEE